MRKYFTSFWLLFLIYIIISSCSPSSKTLRYDAEKQPVKKDLDSTVRFTSITDFQPDSVSQLDTLCCGDEISELEDPSDLPDDEASFDLAELLKRVDNGNGESSLSSDQINLRERVLMEIIKYMNTPYKFGGNSMSGIDCSAFTQTVFREALSIQIFRSAREQFTQGEVISERSDLKFGDLVFFNTRRRVRPGHVGIYIGDNLFAHASTKHGVTISSLDHNYYSARYMGARRIEDSSTL